MMKNRLRILIIILCIPLLVQADEHLTDSLRNLLPTLQGRDKHLTLARIAMITGNLADWDAVVDNAKAQHDTASVCMAMTNRFICMANHTSADSLSTEIQKVLPFMRQTQQWTYYFSTYQTYINELFRERHYEDAEHAADAMFRTAEEEQQPKGMAMALQIQGSMFYQLNLYGKAMKALEEAWRICPDYHRKENQTLVTSTLICEWLCMTALKIEDTSKLGTYTQHYTDVLKWRREIGMGDQAGHFTVTAAAFRAQALLSQGKLREAEQILDEAERSIVPTIPARAYEHYYEALARLYTLQGKHRKALEAADILLTAHEGYFPFYLHDMLRKADILTRLGQPDESRELYLNYIQVKDSIERVEIAKHMDKLNTLYQVDRLTMEKRISNNRFIISLCILGLVLIMLIGATLFVRSLRRKNRVLYLRILEQEKMEKRVFDAIETLPTDNLSKETQLFCLLSERMHEEKLFVKPNLTRKELAMMLNTNESYLANAIRNNTDNKTYHEYITDLRLKYAVSLLIERQDMSIEAIGEAVGYNSRSTFFRAFRDRFGMSPSDFRRESDKQVADRQTPIINNQPTV